MNPLFRIDFSISDSLKIVRKSVLIYETIIINRVCEKSLMYAFQQQKRLVDDYMVKYVVEHEMLGTVTG